MPIGVVEQVAQHLTQPRTVSVDLHRQQLERHLLRADRAQPAHLLVDDAVEIERDPVEAQPLVVALGEHEQIVDERLQPEHLGVHEFAVDVLGRRAVSTWVRSVASGLRSSCEASEMNRRVAVSARAIRSSIAFIVVARVAISSPLGAR